MKVAIVGASGAVGQEFLKVLAERNFPLTSLSLFGSSRSAGNTYKFKDETLTVKELVHGDDFKDFDIVFASAGASISKAFADDITKHGAIMIDNSSAFRNDDDVPLVVPEVNAAAAKNRPRNIVANPNCTTSIMVVPLQALREISPIKSIHVASYQSASGAGASGIEELELQYKQVVNNEPVTVDKFAHQLAYNVIPHIDVFTDNGYTKEEMKMYHETRKILNSDVAVSATCVRVPTLRAHAESVWVETEEAISVEDAMAAFSKANGIVVMDNPAANEYPMPLHLSGKDAVYVGRVRKDLANPKGLAFWCVSDQIKKGAALNAVQIAEYLIKEGEVKGK